MSYHVTFSCIQGPDKGKKWRRFFNQDMTVVIGRLNGCHIRLRDTKISQSHCLLQIQNGRMCVVDMGSLSGTRVNGKAVSSVFELADGDCLLLGESQLLLHICRERGSSPSVSVKTKSETTDDKGDTTSFIAREPDTNLQVKKQVKTHVAEATVISDLSKETTLSQFPICSFCGKMSDSLQFSSAFRSCPSCAEISAFFARELRQYEIVDTPWQVSSHGVIVVVRREDRKGPRRDSCPHAEVEQRDKGLLYISRIHGEISIQTCEELEELIQEGHTHLYPITTREEIRGRLVLFLPYYPGEFVLHYSGEKSSQWAMDVVLAIGQALEYGIERWGYHGAVCPHNIFLEITGHPYLLGYGLPRKATAEVNQAWNDDELSIARFSAPERIVQPLAPTISSEIFSLAASLFTLMSGKRLYSGENLRELESEARDFKPPQCSSEPVIVQKFFDIAMASNPQHRYPGIAHFLDALKMLRVYSSKKSG